MSAVRKKLAWYDNIPLLSYLLLKGRCRSCQGKIPSYYFWTEFFTGALFVLVFWFNWPIISLSKLVFELIVVSILVFVFLFDALYKEILPGAVWLSLAIVVGYYFFNRNIFDSAYVYGALLDFLFFAFQYFISRGRWIGGGDVRYGLFMGALLGWEKTVVALLFAYWLGALVGLLLIAFKRSKLNSEIPFGTFLTAGTLFAMYFGEYVVRWYTNIIG